MTKEEIIHLLTFARVFDNRVTVGKAETAAWFLAVNRVPFGTAQQAVTDHYTAPIEPGAEYPRIAPGHVMAHYQASNRPCDKPPPAIERAVCSPEVAAHYKTQIAAMAAKAAAKFALSGADPGKVPRWQPGMDKQEFALAQVEASRRQRAMGGV